MSRPQRSASVACLVLGLVLGLLVVGFADAVAQAPYPYGASRQSHIATGLDNPALRYFRGTSPITPPQRTPPPAQPVAPQPSPQPAPKPFQGVTPTSTVTPYLALGLTGTDALANYYTIVRPQIQQQQQIELQNAQLVKLQQQLRASGAVVPRGGMPTTGSSVGRFQNYGGYYLTR